MRSESCCRTTCACITRAESSCRALSSCALAAAALSESTCSRSESACVTVKQILRAQIHDLRVRELILLEQLIALPLRERDELCQPIRMQTVGDLPVVDATVRRVGRLRIVQRLRRHRVTRRLVVAVRGSGIGRS